MDYYFLDFHFNSQTLILTRVGQDVAIRNNEARLLAFFLAAPEQVCSKELILDNVWSGKVVSEQAVFQAISNLRALFGDGAIKTYPKKGYQWQVELASDAVPIPATELRSHAGTTTASKTNAVSFASGWRWAVATALLLVTGAVFALLAEPGGTEQGSPVMVLAPFAVDTSPGAAQQANAMQAALTGATSPFSITLLPPTANPEQLLAAPEHFLARYQQTRAADILIAGRLWLSGAQVNLVYYLQGSGYKWQGYITANSAEDAALQLQQLLTKLAPVKLLWESKDRRLIDAQLKLLHNQYPQELAIHHQLIDNLFLQGDVHWARLQAKELEQNAKAAKSIIYETLALVIQANASLDNQEDALNRQLMDKAMALVDSAVAPFLQSQILHCYAGIQYQQKSFAELEQALLHAFAQAQVANAPEQQAQVLRSLAVFSHKFKQPAKRDHYLAQARAMVEHYEFPGESQALLDDIAGMFAQEPEQQENFYRTALERFKPEQDAWVKERAQEHLVNLYISQQRWESAQQVFAQEKILSGAEWVMKARIFWAQQKLQDAQAQAEQGFKQANLSGEYLASLEAALLLVQLHQALMQPDLQKQYRDFIQRNASLSWKQAKAAQLAELGFADQGLAESRKIIRVLQSPAQAGVINYCAFNSNSAASSASVLAVIFILAGDLPISISALA